MDEKCSIFCCNGKVNSNDFELSKTSILIINELERLTNHNVNYQLDKKQVTLFGYNYPASTAILQLKHLNNCLKMQLKILNRYINNDNNNVLTQNQSNTDFLKLRKSIGDFIDYTGTYFLSIIEEMPTMQNPLILRVNGEIEDMLNELSRFLSQLKYIPSSTFHYIVANIGNNCNQPEFHLYHTHLELRWHILILFYSRIVLLQENDQLDKTINLIIDDLIYISTKIFERINLTDLKQKNPYSCTCVRDMWLILQLFINIIYDKYKGKKFWDYVNTSLDGILISKHNNDVKNKKLTWHSEDKINYPEMKNPELFCIWMIYHLTLLYGYSNDGTYIGINCNRITSNYDEIDKILKSFLNNGGKDGDRDEIDEELKIMIPILKEMNDWWPSRITIIALIWDCFHRRLDQTFLIQTSGPWSISLEKKTPFDIIKQIKMRIENNYDSSKESSYGLFLRYLGTLLKKSWDKKDMRIWTQLEGRILTKFQKKKLEISSESKIFNFISLFLTLAVTTDTKRICTAMLNLVPSVVDETSLENPRRSLLNFKSQLACLILYADKRINLQDIAEQILKTIDIICCKEDDLSRTMMSSFLDTLVYVLSSNEILDNGENYLFGSWVHRYLDNCPKSKVGIILKMLINIFPRANDQILDCLWYAARRTRTLVFDVELSSEYYNDIAQLAALFTFCAIKKPSMASKYQHNSQTLFEHFTSIIKVKDIRVTLHYLSIILVKNDTVELLKNVVKNFDLILIQAWIKACIFNHDSDKDEILTLKNNVINLPEIKQLFPSWKDARVFTAEDGSFFRFIIAISTKRKTITQKEYNVFDRRIRMIFKDLEKWILTPINENNINSELAIHIHNCLGSIFFFCSAMLHEKNSNVGPLINLIKTTLLLSEEQSYLKIHSKKIFSKAILGLGTAGVQSDINLHKIFVNLFDKYLPLIVIPIDNGKFKNTEPITRIFMDSNMEFCNFLIIKLTLSFITAYNGNTTHQHCHLVMAVYENFLKTSNCPKWLVESIITHSMTKIIEIYFKVHDMHPHKKQAENFLKAMFKNSNYTTNDILKKKVNDKIATILSNYLSYKPQISFDLLRLLINIDVATVNYIIPIFNTEIIKMHNEKRPNAQLLSSTLDRIRDDVKNIKS
ncbi:protein MMS22-like [Aphidius gifuensis]|uniref:protein MMS22-like n=1 Tax=Aphidius gifuensis TaxID=684658 RepID=UPI001CDD5818|nr:protein MMS22-like [Aphidius gifuensis]